MSTTAPADLGRDWLLRLRWAIVLGQVCTVLFAAYALELPVQLLPALLLAGITAASNLALPRLEPAVAVRGAVVFDLVVLTAILALTGGASNPFSVLYLVHIALAAVMLGPGWTTFATALAVAGFGLLFLFTDPHAMHRAGAGAMQAHLGGMWLAFAVAGGAISWFVARLARALREREAELTRLRRVNEQQERILALATLAAGAAHELGSPLAAIAVSARELELLAPAGSELAEEARSQRGQVERCRAILARLSHQAGTPAAEPLVDLAIPTLWDEVGGLIGARDLARVRFRASPLVVRAPRAALVEALGSLLRNALQAGPGPVEVDAETDATMAVLRVRDAGAGMSEDALARAGEPFFTNRPTGEGMGLGLFLVRRFAATVGGRLELASTPGQGTQARLYVPRGAAR